MARKRRIWLQVVLTRLCVLFFALNIIVFALFLIGNLQEFLDSTQLLLLRIAAVSSFLYVVFGVYSMILAIVQIIRGGYVHALRFVLNIFGLIISGGVLFFSNFLQSWIDQVRV